MGKEGMAPLFKHDIRWRSVVTFTLPLYPRGNNPQVPNWIEGWVDPGACMEGMKKRNLDDVGTLNTKGTKNFVLH